MDILLYREKERIDAVCEYRYNQFIKIDYDLQIHCHDYYELMFFPNNNIIQVVNGEKQELPKGSLVLIRPDDIHDFMNASSEPSFIIHLAFTKNLINCVFDYLSSAFPSKALLEAKMPPYVVLDSLESTDLQNMLNKLNSIDYNNKIAKLIHMRSLLAYIFSQYFYTKNSISIVEIPEWLIMACSKMKQIENFSQGVDRMAQICQRSKEHLSRSMKKHYNTTPSDFINDIRLTYISNMLLSSDTSIIDICFDSGYTNLSWMYTLFKKKFGVSPATFRKTNT